MTMNLESIAALVSALYAVNTVPLECPAEQLAGEGKDGFQHLGTGDNRTNDNASYQMPYAGAAWGDSRRSGGPGE